MIEDKLEIMIPTYNRATYLDRTLNSLLNSPFKDCKITVRDNASLDDTPKVCNKYLKLFSNINVIRNKINIGGNANILRCYEESTMTYVWVLADNDLLNFDYCDDFISAIESEKYGLILCSSGNYITSNSEIPSFDSEGLSEVLKNNSNKSNYLENTAEELTLIIKKYYFTVTSFIPSTIYKTSLFDSNLFIESYNYISQTYPHFPILVKALEDNVLTYKTKNDVVLIQENPGDGEIGPLSFYSRRLECALLVKDKKFREFASNSSDGGILYNSLAHIVVGKATNEENMKRYFINLIATIFKLKGWFFGFFYFILIGFFYLIPKFICDYAYKLKKS